MGSRTLRSDNGFIDHLEWADRYVRSWSGWKRNLLGNVTMEKTPNDDVFPRLHAESDDVLYPNGNFEINERFVAFGGEPAELDNAASIASATLVVAEQLYEMDATLSCAAAHLGDIATELKRLRQVASKRK